MKESARPQVPYRSRATIRRSTAKPILRFFSRNAESRGSASPDEIHAQASRTIANWLDGRNVNDGKSFEKYGARRPAAQYGLSLGPLRGSRPCSNEHHGKSAGITCKTTATAHQCPCDPCSEYIIPGPYGQCTSHRLNFLMKYLNAKTDSFSTLNRFGPCPVGPISEITAPRNPGRQC